MRRYLLGGAIILIVTAGGWGYLSKSDTLLIGTRCWEGVCFVPPQGWSVRTEAPHELVYASPDFTPTTPGMGVEAPATGYLLEVSFGTATREDLQYATPDAYVDAKVARLKNLSS